MGIRMKIPLKLGMQYSWFYLSRIQLKLFALSCVCFERTIKMQFGRGGLSHNGANKGFVGESYAKEKIRHLADEPRKTNNAFDRIKELNKSICMTNNKLISKPLLLCTKNVRESFICNEV